MSHEPIFIKKVHHEPQSSFFDIRRVWTEVEKASEPNFVSYLSDPVQERSLMQALMALSLLLADPKPTSLPVGKSVVEVRFGDVPMKLFTYKPKDFTNGPLVMVFHGVLRNAEEYRDDSVEMGDRLRALIVAPLFDADSFPKPMYQFGGIIQNGKATARDEWTGQYVNRIAREIRHREQLPEMPLYLIGHSGGGQFLIRTAAFVQTDARRIVAANPGTHLFPNTTAQFPFGFGGLPKELQTDEHLKAYLAQPLTIYLGSKDIERDEYLDVTPDAEAQGQTRFERGQNAFAAAKKLAKDRGWDFRWRLVVADGIEHDHTKMFNHARCADALEISLTKQP
jgi:pimeloyl-ACP methyl ester carboxylesterase